MNRPYDVFYATENRYIMGETSRSASAVATADGASKVTSNSAAGMKRLRNR